MSHLLRRPAAVPSLFSPCCEREPVRPRPSRASRPWSTVSAALMLPSVLLTVELPLLRGAAELLRLALPH